FGARPWMRQPMASIGTIWALANAFPEVGNLRGSNSRPTQQSARAALCPAVASPVGLWKQLADRLRPQVGRGLASVGVEVFLSSALREMSAALMPSNSRLRSR